MVVLFCNCGKLCKSEVGLKLHQRSCGVALNCISMGLSARKKSEVVSNNYCSVAQEFCDLSELIAADIDSAFKGNKSASKRSRSNLIKLRNMIISLRKDILNNRA